MIKEAYISFEVAKLLKEKGFNNDFPKGDCTQIACTQQMAMAWLREEKYILIFIVPAKDDIGNLQYMADVFTWNEDEGLYESTWCTADYVYEKTVEAALKYSLENLI